MSKYKLTRGLTLIEVMVAVLVLSIIAVYTLSLLKGQARSEAENKAIVEMKGWLEASQAYYADNNVWPGCSNLDCDVPVAGSTPGTSASFFDILIQQGYMPAYPSPYVNGQAPWPGGTYSGFPNQNTAAVPKGLYFTIQVTAPDTTMAQHIASQLPYGTNAGTVVSASIPMPGADKGYMAGAGVIRLRYLDGLNTYNCGGCCNIHMGGSGSSGTGCSVSATERTIDLPVCAPGFEGHYILAPLAYATGFITGVDYSCVGDPGRKKLFGPDPPPQCNATYSFPGTVVRLGFSDLKSSMYTDTISKNYVYATSTIESSLWIVNNNVISIMKTINPHYIAYYTTFCIPNGSWQAPPGAAPTPNDTQCHNNWAGSGGYNVYAKPC